MHEDDKQPDILTTITEDGIATFHYAGNAEPFMEIGVEKERSAQMALDTVVVWEEGKEVARIPFGTCIERMAVMRALGFVPQSMDWTPLEPDMVQISPNISAIRR